jgi:hypothetical protein
MGRVSLLGEGKVDRADLGKIENVRDSPNLQNRPRPVFRPTFPSVFPSSRLFLVAYAHCMGFDPTHPILTQDGKNGRTSEQ